MIEEQQNQVENNPVIEPEAPEQVEEQVEEAPEQVQEKSYERRESDRDYNFRQLRERAEQAERRNEEYERMMSAKKEKPEQEYPELEDDGLVEGKHLKRYNNNVRSLKEDLEKTKKELANFHATSAELQLRAKFNDFDRVVTNENVERLKREKPALYRAILANPDLKDKGEIAYESIVQYLQPKKFAKQDQRIAENKTKPRSSATITPQASDSPLSKAGDYDRRELSESRKAELWAEMKSARE